MKILEVDLLYDEIFLEKVKLNKSYSQKELFSLLNEYITNWEISINIIKIGQAQKYQLNIIECYVFDEVLHKLNIKITETSSKIIKYLNILVSLFENPVRYIDTKFVKEKMITLINYVEIFSERNYMFSKTFLMNYLNNKNLLVCYYSIRDLLENIELYVYFLIGDKKKNLKNEEDYIYYMNYEEISDKITLNLKNEDSSWDYNFKKIVNETTSLKALSSIFFDLKKYKDICNNYIHKNGFNKISPRLVNKNNNIDLLEVWYKVIKCYFTIIATHDGTKILSSDYYDSFEHGDYPSSFHMNSIAPIFQNFIDSEYTEEEKNKIKNLSNINIE